MADSKNNTFSTDIGGRSVALKRDADFEKKYIDQGVKQYKDALDARLKAEKDFQVKLDKLKENGTEDEVAAAKEAMKDLIKFREEAEEEYQKQRRSYINEHEKEIAAFSVTAAKNKYKQMSVQDKKAYQNKLQEELNAELEQSKQLIAIAIAQGDEKAKRAAEQKKKEVENNIKLSKEESTKLSKAGGTLKQRLADKQKAAQEKGAAANANKNYANENLKAAKKTLATELAGNKEYQKQLKEIDKAKKSGNKADLAEAQRRAKAIEDEAKLSTGYAEAEAEAEKANHEARLAAGEELTANLQMGAVSALGNAAKALTGSIDSDLEELYGQQGRMNARLQEAGMSYQKLVDKVQTNVGMSGVVSQKNVVAKMTQLIDSGVAYNVELRAFLAETSENIASTFNAFDANLLRLIRIQQQDTTAARLGMEASLTKLFNTQFKDTSYLSDGASDSVSGAILDAMATMSRDQALEFEYTAQKWLGALYSLGMSDAGVQSIAEGLNYLGTGNVSALNSNSALASLFTMSAARSGGKSYADLLTGGLTADETNKLLRSMVEYLSEIAEDDTNLVTKSAYAELFGISLTDLRTFSSLRKEEVQSLYASTTSYDTLMTETSNQLSSMVTRLNISKVIDTAIENAFTGASANIGSNAATLGTWKILNIVEGLTGGIHLPAVSAMGNMLDLSQFTIEGLAKTGIAGLGLLSSLAEGLFSGSLFGTSDLNKWGYQEATTRGNDLKRLVSGAASGASSSTDLSITGSASGEDIKSSESQDAKQSAMEDNDTSEEEMKEKEEIPGNILKAIQGNRKDSTLNVIDQLLNITTLLQPDRVFYTAVLGSVNKGLATSIISSHNQISSTIASNTVTTSQSVQSTANTLAAQQLDANKMTFSDDKDKELEALAKKLKEVLRDTTVTVKQENSSILGTVAGVVGGMI